jgi:predicted Zn finger-like uncharacterized protein
MLGTSVCPYCKAIFEVGETQINAHLGLVRCETCQELFDFRTSYVPVHHDPQLEIPISDDHRAIRLHTEEDRISDALAAARQREIFGEAEWIEPRDDGIGFAVSDNIDEAGTPPTAQLIDPPTIEEPPAGNATPRDFESVGDAGIEPDVEYAFAKKSIRFWPWAVGASLSALALLLQGTYFFRVEIEIGRASCRERVS